MRENLSTWNDTIVALASPPGLGAIAVIRLSGPKSIELVASVFSKKNLAAKSSHTVHFGKIVDDLQVIDEVVVTLYKGPKSYTGEEVVEISCHGSPFIQDSLLQLFILKGARLAKPGEFTQRAFLNGKLDLTQAEAVADLIASNTEASRKTALYNLKGGFSSDLQVIDEVVVTLYKGPKSYTGEEVVEISCHGSPFIQDSLLQLFILKGARLAKPGEFTQRAFLNGKLDLTQAEAVADLIASNTEASRKTALYNLKGGFSSDLQVMREKLIKFSALIELELDFSQEDVAFANKKELEKLVAQLQLKTQLLYDSFKLGNVIKNGVQVAIVGKPNAGKSTLLNTLLNEHRALVSEIPGTTRDTVEEYLTIEGVLYKLIDTAGIRSSTSDLIEQMGIDKSIEKIEQADIVIALFDASATTANQIIDWQTAIGNDKMILVGNKVDLGIDPSLQNNEALKDVIFIAAKDKKNIEALRTMLTQKVVGDGLNKEGTIVTNARHATVLKKLLYALVDIETGLANNATGDLLAIDINQALHYLGTITGQITNEDQLDFIFSKFCIGK